MRRAESTALSRPLCVWVCGPAAAVPPPAAVYFAFGARSASVLPAGQAAQDDDPRSDVLVVMGRGSLSADSDCEVGVRFVPEPQRPDQAVGLRAEAGRW